MKAVSPTPAHSLFVLPQLKLYQRGEARNCCRETAGGLALGRPTYDNVVTASSSCMKLLELRSEGVRSQTTDPPSCYPVDHVPSLSVRISFH